MMMKYGGTIKGLSENVGIKDNQHKKSSFNHLQLIHQRTKMRIRKNGRELARENESPLTS